MKIRVCDICGSKESVQRYKLDFIDQPRRVTVDLCDEHQRPLEELAAAIPHTRGPRARMRPLYTKQEVAATKAATAKKAAAAKKKA